MKFANGLTASISRQLAAAFGVGLAAAILLGFVTLYGVDSVSSRIEATANVSLPKVTEMAALTTISSQMETDLVMVIQAAGDTDQRISQMAAEVAQLRGQVDTPDTSTLNLALNPVADDVQTLIQLQDAVEKMQVHLGDDTLTLEAFMGRIWEGNGKYLADLAKAVRRNDFSSVLLDPAQTPFSLWSTANTISDPQLAQMIEAYARAEAEMISFVRDEIAQASAPQPKKLAELRTGPVLDVQAALIDLRDMARDRAVGLATERADTLADLRVSLGLFKEEITANREAALAAMQSSVSAAGEQAVNVKKLTYIVLGIATIGTLLSAFVVVARVGRPLRGLHAVLGSLSNGDETIEIPWTGRRDEIGAVSRSVAEFRDTLAETRRLTEQRDRASALQAKTVERLASAMEAIASCDLTCRVDEPFSAEYEGLRNHFNSTIDILNALVGEVVEDARDIHSRAVEIASGSTDLARRTENQAATLEQTAAAMDEMTASVRQAASGAARVETMVSGVSQEAESRRQVVEQAMEAMSGIKKSSDEISKITGLIDEIAFQTNLLALNAGVEAARAGEAGRGFAVVASEVRSLAQRSSEAANDIKVLIDSGIERIDSGVALVDQTGDALSEIIAQIREIAQPISEIATGATQQSVGLSEINTGIGQLDQVTQQNAAMVEQTTAASAELQHKASHLASLVRQFRLSEDDDVPDVAPVAATGPAGDAWHVAETSAPKPARNHMTAGAWEEF